MMLLKLFGFVWPYIKELVLGDRSIRHALRYNKFRMTVIGLIFLSIGLNFFAVPKVFTLSARIVDMQKKPCPAPKPEVKEKQSAPEVVIVEKPTGEPPKVVVQAKRPKQQPVKEDEELKEALREIRRLKQREEMEHNK